MTPKLITRIKAAIIAFKDPLLIGEARGMRNTLEALWRNDEAVLLEASLPGAQRLVPKFTHLPQAVRDLLTRMR